MMFLNFSTLEIHVEDTSIKTRMFVLSSLIYFHEHVQTIALTTVTYTHTNNKQNKTKKKHLPKCLAYNFTTVLHIVFQSLHS